MLCAALLLACGCSHMPVVQNSKDAPGWVARGSGSFSDEGGKAFYAVGTADVAAPVASLRTVADDRARFELLRILKANGAPSAVTEAVIIDHWIDPKTGTTYALCRLSDDR